MKSTVAIGIIALVAFAGSPVVANAKSMAHGRDPVVTGCLESGGNAGQYKLTEQDGTALKVKQGQYVDLASYVGQTVTVAGPEARKHGKTEGQITALDEAVDGQSCHQ